MPDRGCRRCKLGAKFKINKLRRLLDEVAPDSDRRCIDTPPAMNFYAFSALIAADAVLILFDCDILARLALNQMRTQVADLKTYQNKSLVDEGIVINHYSSVTGFYQKLVEELIVEGLPVFHLFADRQQSTQYSRSRV
ncbi:ParA family protein [Pseudomonas sp. GNP012]